MGLQQSKGSNVLIKNPSTPEIPSTHMQIRTISRTAPEGSPFARHIPALDGVRGLAILGVAGSHLFPFNGHSGFETAIHNALSFGASGVDLFFVLSGFLITGILFDSLGDPEFFRKFYARRVLRIFPLYYGVLAGFGVAALLLRLNFHSELLSLSLYLQNSALIAPQIRDYAGPSVLPLSHFWSLAIEEQFYLAWPVTIFLLRKRQRLLLVCVAAFLLCPLLRFFLLLHGVGYFTIHTNTLCRADTLLAGGALALLLRCRHQDRVRSLGGWLFAAGALAIIVVNLLLHAGLISRTSTAFQAVLASGYSLSAVMFSGLLAMALGFRYIGNLFSLRPMRWLGKYSYGIYVIHVILFVYLEEPIRNAIRLHLTTNKGAVVVLTGLFLFLLSISAAYLSYNLYEKRFLRLKRYFEYRRLTRSVDAGDRPALSA